MWPIFDFNPFALISLFTALTVLSLIIYVGRQQYQTGTLRWLNITLTTMLVWSVAEFFIRISANAYTASLFKYWEIAGYVLLGPVAVGLCLAYVGKEHLLTRWRWQLGLFLPALVLIYAAWTLDGFVPLTNLQGWHRAWYGEWTAPLNSLFTLGYIPWFNLLLVFAVAQLVAFYIRVKSPAKRRQVTIFLLAVILPSIAGLITDQLWEPLTGFEMIEMATFTTALSGLWITYGIVHHRLFEVNPAVIATNILATMRDVVIVCSPAMEIEFVSQRAEQLLGYRSHDLTGQNFKDYVASGWGALSPLLQNPTTENASAELQMKTGDQGVLPVGVTVSTFRDDRHRVLAYVMLVADLRQLQELAHVTEERDKLQATLSSISDGVVGIDAKGNIALVNEAFTAMFDRADGIQGQPFDDVVALADRYNPIVLQDLIGQVANSSRQGQFGPLSMSVNKSQSVDVSIVSSGLSTKQSIGLVAILSIHNISRERELERMKSTFTYKAAHELRTPLISIRGYLNLLTQEVGKSLAKDQNILLERANISADHLSRLVDQLLTVSAIEQGSFTIQPHRVEWGGVLSEVISHHEQESKQQGYKFTSMLPPETILVNIDVAKIQQVLHVLLGNAKDYSKPPAEITLSCAVKNNFLYVSVSDKGHGIEPDRLQQLFKPFSRRDTGLEQTKQGAGLSSFIASTIIKHHGGDLRVASQRGEGSTSTFSLPLIKS